MLLPKFSCRELNGFVWLNLSVMGLMWLGQLANVKRGLPALGVVMVFSVLALLMDYGPLIFKSVDNAEEVDHIRLDLNVAFSVYGLLYLLLPGAFSPQDRAGSLAVLGVVFSVGSLSLAYVHRNRYVGIRFPQTYASPIVWHKTNLLGARLGFVSGIVFFLAAGLFGADVGIIVLLVGVGLLALCTWTYAQRLSRHNQWQ